MLASTLSSEFSALQGYWQYNRGLLDMNENMRATMPPEEHLMLTLGTVMRAVGDPAVANVPVAEFFGFVPATASS